MKKIVLIFLVFFSLWNIVYAIPIPWLYFWYEILLFIIPSVLTFLTFIYFYFKKYLFYINIFCLIIVFILYFVHFFLTKEIFLYKYEYLFFIILLLFLLFSYIKKIIGFFLLILILSLNIFFIKIDYNLLSFRLISNCVENTINSTNIKITEILYKDNFIVIYWYDTDSKIKAYSVIENWLLEGWFYLNKWKYYIVYWLDWNLWRKLSFLSYNCIK